MITLDWQIVFIVTVLFLAILSMFIYLQKELTLAKAREAKLKVLRSTLEAKLKELTLNMEQNKSHLFQQSKMTTMGEMMENIAHQWRQPLSQINSAVLLIDDSLYEKNFKNIIVEEKLLEIESLTKYMSKTIDDFRNFFDGNKSKENFSLNELIAESIYIVQGTLKSHHIEISFDLNEKFIYHSYPRELQQTIVIILNNAKDALLRRKILMPKIVINVTKAKSEHIITISDNARGISEDMLEKIFDPYVTTKHKAQGTGLGLYIAKMIVHTSMGGELTVKNTDEGACFEIKLKEENGR